MIENLAKGFGDFDPRISVTPSRMSTDEFGLESSQYRFKDKESGRPWGPSSK